MESLDAVNHYGRHHNSSDFHVLTGPVPSGCPAAFCTQEATWHGCLLENALHFLNECKAFTALPLHCVQLVNALFSLRKMQTILLKVSVVSGHPPVFTKPHGSLSAQDPEENGDHWSSSAQYSDFQFWSTCVKQAISCGPRSSPAVPTPPCLSSRQQR